MNLVAFVMLALLVTLFLGWPQHHRGASVGRRERFPGRDGHPYRTPGVSELINHRERRATSTPRSLALARARVRVRELHGAGRFIEAARMVLQESEMPLATALPVLIDAKKFRDARTLIAAAFDEELEDAWQNADDSAWVHHRPSLSAVKARDKWMNRLGEMRDASMENRG